MDKLDRIYDLHRTFSTNRKPVSVNAIAQQWGASAATVKRAIEALRDRYLAPVIYCEQAKGWHYERNNSSDTSYELPGFWLTSHEIEALAIMLSLLHEMKSQIFAPTFNVIEKQLATLLKGRGIDITRFQEKIKVINTNQAQPKHKTLSRITEALNSNKCLNIFYTDYSGQQTQREISPQTLIYYSEHWYLDAWCHLRQQLRSFKLAGINNISITQAAARNINSTTLEEHFGKTYGIFAGKAKHTATIQFYGGAAREAAQKIWHPEQTLQWANPHELTIGIPYSDDRELVRDILQYGAKAKVINPPELKNKLHNQLKNMLKHYQKDEPQPT